MATNINIAESTAPLEEESDVLHLLNLLKNRVIEEFNSIQTHLDERKTVLLAQINALELKSKQSIEANDGKISLDISRKELLKISTRSGLEQYKTILDQLEVDIRKLSAQIVEFSNIALQIDSRELMESIDKLGHFSYECKVSYENRKIPFQTSQEKIQNSGYIYNFGLACDNDNIYIASSKTNKINVYTADGVYIESLPAERPVAVCVRNTTLYISEWKSHTICKMNTDGSSVKRIGANGTELGQFDCSFGLTTNAEYLFVCDWNNHRLQVFTHELQPIRIIKTGDMHFPSDININNNALYVLNNYKSILVISVEGQLLTHLDSIQNHISYAYFFCIDHIGNILINDNGGNCIQVFSISGQYLHTLGRGMNTATNKPYCNNTYGICIQSNGVIVNTSYSNNICYINHF